MDGGAAAGKRDCTYRNETSDLVAHALGWHQGNLISNLQAHTRMSKEGMQQTKCNSFCRNGRLQLQL
jgi:hypothetical protein